MQFSSVSSPVFFFLLLPGPVRATPVGPGRRRSLAVGVAPAFGQRLVSPLDLFGQSSTTFRPRDRTGASIELRPGPRRPGRSPPRDPGPLRGNWSRAPALGRPLPPVPGPARSTRGEREPGPVGSRSASGVVVRARRSAGRVVHGRLRVSTGRGGGTG